MLVCTPQKVKNYVNKCLGFFLYCTILFEPRIVSTFFQFKSQGVDKQGRIFPFISDQKYNDAIKEIFRICGVTRIVTVLNPVTSEEEKRPINEVASSNMARRTFTGNLYKRVKDQNLISSMTGHKPGSTAFARYRDIDMDIKTEMIDLLNE